MTSLPGLTGKELLSVLKKAGFELIRIKGSHHFLRHSDGQFTLARILVQDYWPKFFVTVT